MKYLIRSIKYFIYFSLMCTVIVSILVLIGAVEGDINSIFEPSARGASFAAKTSGLTDIMDLHDYEQNPEVFAAKLAPLAEGGTYNVHWHAGPNHVMEAKPTFVSEYGGIRWAPKEDAGWGYGQAPMSEEEFIARFKGLTEAILFHPKMGALCYTQLTDVEQEVNGLYTYHRVPKFDPAIMHAIMTQKAAVED